MLWQISECAFCGVPAIRTSKTFDLRRERTTEETCFVIIRSLTQHQRRAMARLLVPGLLCPACGVKFSHTMSPASGTYRGITTPLRRAQGRNQQPDADSSG